MFESAIDNVLMDFIRENHDVVCCADFSQPRELLFTPNASDGIVRVADNDRLNIWGYNGF